MITADQIRAGRALKNWSQTDLAHQTGLAVPTIANIESGKQEPSKKTLTKIMDGFDIAGIEFIGTRGVQEKHQRVRTFEGVNGFKRLLDEVYEVAKNEGGELCLFNSNPDNWYKWLGKDWYDTHSERMEAVKDNFTYKILVKEGQQNFISKDFAEYRWIPEEWFDERAPFYVYGGRIAFIDFQEHSLSIARIKQAQAARAMRIVFNSAWDNLAIMPSLSA